MLEQFGSRAGRFTMVVAALFVLAGCGDKEEATEEVAEETTASETETPRSVREVFANSDLGTSSPVPSGKPVVLVVNQAQVFGSSLVGQDLRAKLTTIQEEIKIDQEQAMNDLVQEVKDLSQQKAILPSDQFRKKQQELMQKEEVIKFKFGREMEAAQSTGENKIMARLSPIMQQIMVERKGTILVDQSNVMLSAPEYGITDEAIKRLDAAMPSIELERKTFDELAKEAEERTAKRKAAQEARAAEEAEGASE